ncbi:rhodanese-related sulfurtransferase [soil metagenome]
MAPTMSLGSEQHESHEAGTTDDALSVRIAALYGFATIPDPESLRSKLEIVARDGGVRGTLLLAHEGINGTIAGAPHDVEAVLAIVRAQPGLAAPEIKYADAAVRPFHRLKVRVKPEIVTMGRPDIDPAKGAGTYVAVQDWNALIADPDTLLIDTRNDYEGEIGAFANAVQPNTAGFRDFPAWFETEGRALIAERKPQRVAMYCTGGIRCEKASALLKAEGVDDVRHLHGGILRYLEAVPAADSLWNGECFVFDERVSVGHGLAVGDHVLCRGCRMPVSAEGRASPRYVEGVSCDRCWESRTENQRRGYEERRRQIELAEARGEGHIGVAPPAKSGG